MKQRLYEMDVCRAIATMSVVFTHSFAPFSGSWDIPVENVYLYKCIGLFSNVFNLCLFVFISGYVFSFQDNTNPPSSKKKLIWKKFKRLIIPCLFWGGQYSLLFGVDVFSPRGLFSYLSGLGHLWFLPMLFWVFVVFLPLRNSKSEIGTLLLLCLISIITPNIMSLGLLSALHYLLWFFCGYYLFKNRSKIQQFSFAYFLMLFVALVIIFMSYVEVRPKLNELRDMGMIFKFIYQIVEHSILVPIAIAGIAFVYLLSIRIIKHFNIGKKESPMSSMVFVLSRYSMGIYIFHDFIIELLYRNTGFLNYCSLYAPWLAVVLSIILSVIISKIVFKIPYLCKTI